MTLDEIIKEVKENSFATPFYEVAMLLVNQLCKATKRSTTSDEMFDLKLEYARALRNEYEIRPIIEDCERLLGRRV